MVKRQVPGLDLWSYWAEGADYKAEMDPNLATLSVLCQAAAKSRTTVLPGSGLAGDIYIVRDDAVSNANDIAYWDGPSGTEVWNYLTPKEGWRVWVSDEDKLYVWDGSAWVEFEQGSGGGSSGPSDTGYVARNARFWALLDLESGGTEVSAVQMEVRGSVGGAELVVTPSASSEDGANVAGNAYDDDAGTYWRSSGDNGQARFIYDAGTNGGDPNDPIQVNVAEIAITARGGGDEAEAPTRFILAYADDEGIWVPVARIVTDAWTAGETKTFDVTAFTKRIEIAADDLRVDSAVALASGAYESTGLDLADKDGLQVFFDRIDVDTSNEQLNFTLFVGGVEVVTGYEFRTRVTSHNTGGDQNYQAQAAGTAVQITGDGSTWGINAATSEISGMIEVYGTKDGDWKLGKAVVVHKAATGTTVTAETYFRLRSAGAITGWKIAPSAGNIESGDVYERLIEASAFGASEGGGGGGGASAFTDLTDTPGSLGTEGQVPRVATGGTALEFYTPVDFPDWSIRTETGNFTLVDADFNGRTHIRVNSASDVTITLNTGLTTNGPVFIEKVGAGDVLFDGTAVIVGADTVTTQYDILELFFLNTSNFNGRLLLSEAGSGGSTPTIPANTVSARYWRFIDVSGESGTELRASEWQLRDGANTTITPSSRSSDKSLFSGSLSSLDDNDSNTSAWWGSGAVPVAYTLDLGSAQAPFEVYVRAPSSGGQQQKTPSNWTLQYSDDNTNWTTLMTVEGETGWSPLEERTYQIENTTLQLPTVDANDAGKSYLVDASGVPTVGYPTESIIVAVSDETTDLTTGAAKVTFRMPYAFTLTGVRASVSTAPTGAALQVDINEAGVSILSTVLSIDAGEKTSTTAATPAVISDAALADDAEITIDIDQIGSTVAGAGLKVTLIGTKT